ncbi:MAG: PilZ domain-containing protein [Magnetococcales bacterium]|nr:PilZ domain-containing protein [Magnetococcales bacterium]
MGVANDFSKLAQVTRAARIELSTRVLLELNNGRGYIGATDNISESGVFFTLGYRPVTINRGEFGFLHVMPLSGHRPLPCQVARLTESGIAIQFVDRCPLGQNSVLVPARFPHGNESGTP